MFNRALELLEDTEKVKVFAPTGLWAISKDKQVWIEELGRMGDRVSFIGGSSKDHEHEDLVNSRLEILKDTNLCVIPPQSDFRLGFIIFDNVAMLGLDTATKEEFSYIELISDIDIKTLHLWFDNYFKELCTNK